MTLEETTDLDSIDTNRYIGQIPVRNLWLLMLYASDIYKELDMANVAIEENPNDIPDLVAEILCRRVESRIQRNLNYSYQSRVAVLNRVRGRIDLFSTKRHRLLERGKVACRFDELTIDTPRNRYVRAALEVVAQLVRNKTLAHKCRLLDVSLRRMGVSQALPSRGEISIDRFGRHDIEDKPMVTAAHLVFNIALPTENNGTQHLPLPDRTDLPWLRKLFEKGVSGFYETVLSKPRYSVSSGKVFKWQVTEQSLGIEKILPNMKTDIIVDDTENKHRIVIDTKFNTVLIKGWYRESTLRSGYLYQMYTYLRSQEKEYDTLNNSASGLFIHPAVNYSISEHVTIQNHTIKFSTVDLSASAQEIRSRLIKIIENL